MSGRRVASFVRPALVLAGLAVAAAGRVAHGQVPLLYSLDARQNPRGIDWRKIETEHFTVVFADSLGHDARRAASLLEATWGPLRRTLGGRRERIPVLLNDRSMESNAFVAWGPRRSIWYPLPPTTADMAGPLDWYTMLAAHEGRHVVQQEAVRTGLVGLADRLFGDNTASFLGGALYFPSWWWEGDAVGMETALTESGRGRQPSFMQRIRALRAEGRRYDYWPAWLGSYRTYYPDWYELGFLLTTHVRRRYGADAWSTAVRRAARNPIAPLALSRALKRTTGRTLAQLHRDAVLELDSLWAGQRALVHETPARRITADDTAYHHWSLPQYAGDGSLIATYSDLSTVKRLERLRNGKREVLVRNIALPGELQFHVSGDRVVWSEYEVSPRWGEESFLVIKRLDLSTGRIVRLTDRTRYFAPTLSPDARRIAAVHFSQSRRAEVVILDADDGRELQRLPNMGGDFLVTPTWAPDGRSLYVVAIDEARGNALVRHSMETTAVDTVLPFGHDAISRPWAAGGRVYFGSPRSGLDALYAVDTASRRVGVVATRRLGARWPAVSADGRRLAFVDYSVRGQDIAELALDSATFVPESTGEPTLPGPTRYADPVSRQEAPTGRGPIGVVSDSVPWRTEPYRGIARVLDFHSVTLAPTTDASNVGLALESRNLLNTFGLSAGATFNVNERAAAAEVGASYAGLPVIVDVAGRLGSRASSYTDTLGAVHGYSWNEQSITTTLRLPLTRVVGLTRQSLVLSAGAAVTRISDQPVAFRNENNNGRFAPFTYAATALHLRPAAYRDLYPTGVVATAVYRHTPVSDDYRSHQASLSGAAYLPGLFANHALVLDATREVQDPVNYRFSQLFLFPRGYSSRFHERFTRAGAAYHLPLLYPDLALGPWLYVRRVQGAAFGDVGRGSTRTGAAVRDYRSVGAELTADVAPFGLRQTIRTGVRVSQTLTGTRQTVAEWIVSVY